MPDTPPKYLSYAPPQALPWDTKSLVGGALGVLSGLFSVVMLAGCGIVTVAIVVESARHHKIDLWDIREAACFGLIGLVSLAASIRWIRNVFRKRRADLESSRTFPTDL